MYRKTKNSQLEFVIFNKFKFENRKTNKFFFYKIEVTKNEEAQIEKRIIKI